MKSVPSPLRLFKVESVEDLDPEGLYLACWDGRWMLGHFFLHPHPDWNLDQQWTFSGFWQHSSLEFKLFEKVYEVIGMEKL